MKRFSKIRDYIGLLKDQNEVMNLYSKKSYDKMEFHIQDCVNIAEMITNHECKVVDLGSGAGLPSIIISIMNPLNQVTAMESSQKKAKFLLDVKEKLNLCSYIFTSWNMITYI